MIVGNMLTPEEEKKRKEEEDRKRMNLIIGFSVAGFLVLVAIVVYLVWKNRKESNRRAINRATLERLNKPLRQQM